MSISNIRDGLQSLGMRPKKTEEQKKVEEMESRACCCMCSSEAHVRLLATSDLALFRKIFERPWLTERMHVCSVCRSVAAGKAASISETGGLAVTARGEWSCHKCLSKNSPVARVCDTCGERRLAETQGIAFVVNLAHREEGLGLDCSIVAGAVTIVDVNEGGRAHKAGVPLGLLTQVNDNHVHTEADLKRFVAKARADVKEPNVPCTISLRVIPTDAIAGATAAPPKAAAVAAAAGKPRATPPTPNIVSPQLQNLFGPKPPPNFGLGGLTARRTSGSSSRNAPPMPMATPKGPPPVKTAASAAAADEFDFNPRANEPKPAQPQPIAKTSSNISVDDLFDTPATAVAARAQPPAAAAPSVDSLFPAPSLPTSAPSGGQALFPAAAPAGAAGQALFPDAAPATQAGVAPLFPVVTAPQSQAAFPMPAATGAGALFPSQPPVVTAEQQPQQTRHADPFPF